MQKEMTSIQISKEGLAEINKAKLNHCAKIGKNMSMEDYLLELVQ